MISISSLKNKKVLILGLGKEGTSTLKFLRKKFPKKVIGLADQKTKNQLENNIKKIIKADKNLEFHLGKNYQKSMPLYDVIFKSPGVCLVNPDYKKVTSQTELFLSLFKNKVIGVTGTNGKSTTASLIYKILSDAKMKVKLIGNIGTPPFDYLDQDLNDTTFVYELSSYQLQGLKESPHIAVFLNVFKEHLDYHGSYQDYADSKANIAKWQKKEDYLIYNIDSKPVFKLTENASSTKIPFSTEEKLPKGAYVDKGWIFYNGEKILKTNDIKLKGQFNLNNVLAAVIASKLFGVSNALVANSIKSFIPLKHRLEYVGNYHGIEFYNDSISTIPEATIAALETLRPNVQTVILGGFNRGIDFSKLAEKILEEKIKNLILFPQTGKIILESMKKRKPKYLPKVFHEMNMKDAVATASKITEKSKICLLSPASASFGMFKNYEDRGEQFVREVKKLN